MWVGASEQRARPVLSWSLEGPGGRAVSVAPRVVRPLTEVGGPDAPTRSTVTGVVEFDLPKAWGSRPHVSVTARLGQQLATLSTRPVPAAFEPGPRGATFSMLLASCYSRDEDDGSLGRTARFVARRFRPDITLLMGDQVYLDLPTLRDFPPRNPALLSTLEAKYRRAWLPPPGATDTFADLLRVAPSLCIPDDHEYWNNAPHASPFIQNSWTKEGRAHWREDGDLLFEAYQNTGSIPFAPHRQLDVGPLSLFVANGRTFRQEDRSASFHADTPAALATWAGTVKQQARFGAFLTGQSLLDLPSTGFTGATRDYTQANYGDYARVMGPLERLARDAADVLLLTGDVHYGRVAELTPTTALGTSTRLYEVISSPATLVTTLGADSLARARNWLTGNRQRWPRHAEPAELDALLRLPGSSFATKTTFPHRGDQLCVLELTQAAGALDVTAHFVEVGTCLVSSAPTFRMRRRPT